MTAAVGAGCGCGFGFAAVGGLGLDGGRVDPPDVDPPPSSEPLEPLEVEPFGVTCWRNGSLLAKRLKEVSWSIEVPAGTLEEARSAELADGVEPPSVGGASGTVPVEVVDDAAAARSGSTFGPVSCFNVCGPSNPSTARRTRPRTPARIFWRLAFALRSTFLATRSSRGRGAARDRRRGRGRRRAGGRPRRRRGGRRRRGRRRLGPVDERVDDERSRDLREP